ncbi:PP2C family protein-serine/threonine phosphatase [Jatrophihabitans fulvus]
MAPALTDRHYAAFFAAAPVALLVFDAELTMVDANQAYLDAVGMRVEQIRGRRVFDVFVNNPAREGFDQSAALQLIMRRAIEHGETQVLAAYRYDILGPRGFEVRYWNVTEVPVLDADGRTEFVLHYTEDITELVQQREEREETAAVNERLQLRVAAAQADLRRRADELEVLNERLRLASERDRSIAEALQQAMLTKLPDVDPLRLTARYRAAAEGDKVGGDWYDAVRMGDGSTTVMIGDVVGHDIGAAALMGQLRSMLRAFSWASDAPPSTIMSQLDRAMRDLRLDTYASVVLANISEPAASALAGERLVTWTNAGHPPPILVDAAGDVRLLNPWPPALLLGVAPDVVRDDHEVVLTPGATLCFYTDGLVEARGGDIVERTRIVQESLTRLRHLPASERIEQVIDELVGPRPEDDVAVLLVELDPLPRSSAVAPT